MKKSLFAVCLLLALTALSFAQEQKKTDAALIDAMAKFKTAITKKDTAAFLSLVSRTRGLTIMNTIDQGEAGNVDKPMLDSKIKYATLAADFKKKGDRYANFFMQSEFAPSFYDQFTGYKGEWQFDGKNKFMPTGEDQKPVRELYLKWEKEGKKWVVTEIGMFIS